MYIILDILLTRDLTIFREGLDEDEEICSKVNKRYIRLFTLKDTQKFIALKIMLDCATSISRH